MAAHELVDILQRLEAAENSGDADAQGKYFWLYSRDNGGSWRLSRMIVSLDDAPEKSC